MSRERVSCYGIEFDVEFDYSPAERGSRERGTGLQMEPDYDESFDVTSIFLADSETDLCSVLDAKVIDAIQNELATDMAERREEAKYEAAEARRDADR